MIKIVHVVEDLKIGGIERIIEHIALFLNARRFEIDVLCLSEGGAIADKLVTHKKNVTILNITNFHNPFSVLKVATWLKRKKIDIVHTHGYPAGVLGRVASFFAGVPCIFHHVHSTYFNLHKRNHLIERFLGRFTQKVICCSESVKRYVLEQENIPEDKLIVIYNGIPEPKTLKASEVKGLRKSLDIPRKSKVIGCVASLTQHKGHRYLLEALQTIDDTYLLLIGDGPLRRKLADKASTLNIDSRVIFAGSQIEATLYMHIMDIVVLSSAEREGLGISLIEAMALSKPVVATNIGGIPEVVDDGRTGILVSPRDSDALANALRKLLTSAELMRDLGLQGRERYIEMFTLNNMLRRIEELYEGCK
jgi:glycosyltransferase involved in cell wall biosynthesis